VISNYKIEKLLIPYFIVGIVLSIYPGYKTYEYVWKDASFCTSCHVHDYASNAWQASSHNQITTCHDCHHQPLRSYFKEFFIMIVKQPKYLKGLERVPHVPKEICSACHISDYKERGTISGPMRERDISKIPKIDQTFLHKLHLERQTDLELYTEQEITDPADIADPKQYLSRERGPKRKIICVDCHGGITNRAHSFVAVDLACTRCHYERHPSGFVTEYGCRHCHFQDFRY